MLLLLFHLLLLNFVAMNFVVQKRTSTRLRTDMPAQSPSDPPMLDTMSTHDMLAVMVTCIVDRVLLNRIV